MNIAFVRRACIISPPVLDDSVLNAGRILAGKGNRAFLITDDLAAVGRAPLPEGLRLVETEPSRPERREFFLAGDQEYSYRVLRTLRRLAREGPVDLVVFPDFGAEGFASIRAKRLLNEFQDTVLAVECHTPKSLLFSQSGSKSLQLSQLCEFAMEDYCVRHSDLVVSTSPAVANYFEQRVGRKDIRTGTHPGVLDPAGRPPAFDWLQAGSVDAPARSWLKQTSKKVSVVLPYFNQGPFLAEAIQSVRNSNYPNLEIIVVNDGSTDPAANEVFEAIEEVIKVRKENGGVNSARNAGIRIATGEFVLMLDADDKIHPDYISVAVEALENNPALSYVTCHARLFGELDCAWVTVGFVPAAMLFHNTGGCCANVYRRGVFSVCGGYDEKIAAFEDWDFLLTMAEHGLEGDVLPDEYFFYRRSPGSMLLSVAQLRRVELMQHLMLKHPKLLAEHAPRMAVVLAGLWKQEEMRVEDLQKQVTECARFQNMLADHGLMPPDRTAPAGALKRALFGLMGPKFRRSLRRRLASLSRWLLTPQP